MFDCVAETVTDRVVETTTSVSSNTLSKSIGEQSADKYRPGRFLPGNVANPAGRPKGSRNKLGEDFVGALYEDFSKYGVGAIVATRESDPAKYVSIIASLLPKEVELKRPLEGLSEDELMAAVATLQAMMAGMTIDGEASKVIGPDVHDLGADVA
jgi:hypothetical protein